MTRLIRITLTSSLFASLAIAQAHASSDCSVSMMETDAEKAIMACSTRLQLSSVSDVEKSEAIKIRGRSYRKLKQVDAAIRDFDVARQLIPNDPEPDVWLGWMAFEKRDYSSAFEHAEKSVNRKNDYARAYELYGSVLAVAGPEHVDASAEAYAEAIRLDPTNPNFHLNRLRLFKGAGRNEEMLKEAEAMLAMPTDLITKPDSTKIDMKPLSFRTAALLERASALQAIGRRDDARKAYDELVEREPGAVSYTWRAKFKASRVPTNATEQTAFDAAEMEDLDKALEIDPDYWRAREEKAFRAYVKKDYNAAAQDYVRSLAAYPINGEVRWFYARTLRAMGKTDEATAEAISAFNHDPAFMMAKVQDLQKLGYVAAIKPDADPRPAFNDAARACMIDEKCL